MGGGCWQHEELEMTETTKWVGDIAPDKLDLLIRKLQQKKAPANKMRPKYNYNAKATVR